MLWINLEHLTLPCLTLELVCEWMLLWLRSDSLTMISATVNKIVQLTKRQRKKNKNKSYSYWKMCRHVNYEKTQGRGSEGGITKEAGESSYYGHVSATRSQFYCPFPTHVFDWLPPDVIANAKEETSGRFKR